MTEGTGAAAMKPPTGETREVVEVAGRIRGWPKTPPMPATAWMEERKAGMLWPVAIMSEMRLDDSLTTGALARGWEEASWTTETTLLRTMASDMLLSEAALRTFSIYSRRLSPSTSLEALLKVISSIAVKGGESSRMMELKQWRMRYSEYEGDPEGTASRLDEYEEQHSRKHVATREGHEVAEQASEKKRNNSALRAEAPTSKPFKKEKET